MVQINIGTGQGITQAIRDKIGAGNIKNSDLGTWQKVVAEVNNAQAKDKSVFKSGENNTTDTTKLDDSSTYHSNFVVDEGNIEIDDGVWSRIKALLTGKTESSVPAKETKPSNAPVQSENKNVTSNEQTLASKDNNTEIQNQETFQTPKKYLSAGDLEQCKQMLHLEELPDGVSIAKENGQFLYFKDGKQISFQEVKNLAQKAPVHEAIVEPKISENLEAKKSVENSELKQPENSSISQTDYSFLAVKDLSNKGKKVTKDGVTYQYDDDGYIIRGFNKDGQKIFETSMQGNSLDARFMSTDEMLESGEGEIIVETYNYSNDKKLTGSEERLLDGTLVSSHKFDEKGNELEDNTYSDGKILLSISHEYDAKGNETKKLSRDGDGNIQYIEESVYDAQNKATKRYMYTNPEKVDSQKAGEDGVQIFEKNRVDRNAKVGEPIAFRVVIDRDGNIIDEVPTLYQE